MDKKNVLIGITLLLAAFAFYIWDAQRQAERMRDQAELEEAIREEEEAAQAENESGTGATAGVGEQSRPSAVAGREAAGGEKKEAGTTDTPAEPDRPSALQAEPEAQPALSGDSPETSDASLLLENDYITVDFNPEAGAIRQVFFNKTGPEGEVDPYVFNERAPRPALSLSLALDDDELMDYPIRFETVEETKNEDRVTFRHTAKEGFVIERTYWLPRFKEDGNGGGEWVVGPGDDPAEPYLLYHQTEILNIGEENVRLYPLAISVGTASPAAGGMRGDFMYLNFARYDGNKAKFFKARQFAASGGFLGMGSRPARDLMSWAMPEFVWSAVKNQFFVAVLNERVPEGGTSLAERVFAKPVRLRAASPDADGGTGVTGFVAFDFPTLRPGESRSVKMDYYVGPKEYTRLRDLDQNQDKLMQFGAFTIISVPLLLFMRLIHELIPNWGWSIVVMTLVIRTVLWPITLQAVKNQKRMSVIQEPMKSLKEKYKDNPQKMQQETLKLFREYKVNPAAGCLPMLMQIPIFLGLFWMLRTASELRFADFLWVTDLSQADTVGTIAGFPINILPVTMAGTMYIQMRMMPMNPAADETQQLVQKMFRFMPAVMLIFLYNFAAGLTLYWTMSNCVTILQQSITNRSKTDEPAAAAAETEGKDSKLAGMKRAEPAGAQGKSKAQNMKQKLKERQRQAEPEHKRAERRAQTKGAHGGGGKKKKR